jgi:hypothetical protein
VPDKTRAVRETAGVVAGDCFRHDDELRTLRAQSEDRSCVAIPWRISASTFGSKPLSGCTADGWREAILGSAGTATALPAVAPGAGCGLGAGGEARWLSNRQRGSRALRLLDRSVVLQRDGAASCGRGSAERINSRGPIREAASMSVLMRSSHSGRASRTNSYPARVAGGRRTRNSPGSCNLFRSACSCVYASLLYSTFRLRFSIASCIRCRRRARHPARGNTS